MRKAAGVTLIELLIVVVIIGIIAAIVYPSYRSYAVKSNRAAAQSFMLSVAGRQEQLLLDKRLYESAATNSDVLSNIGLEVPNEVARFYALTVVATNPSGGATAPPSYTVTATPLANTAQAGDPVLMLDSTGNRTPEHVWR